MLWLKLLQPTGIYERSDVSIRELRGIGASKRNALRRVSAICNDQ